MVESPPDDVVVDDEVDDEDGDEGDADDDDDDPPKESPNGQGEASDAVQSAARVYGRMASKTLALRRYMVTDEYSFKSRSRRNSTKLFKVDDDLSALNNAPINFPNYAGVKIFPSPIHPRNLRPSPPYYTYTHYQTS